MSPDDLVREEYRGYTIRLVPDPDPENPREGWDNVGTMRCWHRRYNLGDMPKDGREQDPEGLLRHLAEEADKKFRLWSGLMEAVEGRHFPEHQKTGLPDIPVSPFRVVYQPVLYQRCKVNALLKVLVGHKLKHDV